MLIAGVWHECDDTIVRPVIRGEIQGADGAWLKVPFLVDTGADVTVLSADVLRALDLPAIDSPGQLGGAGGVVESVVVAAEIRFTHDKGGKATFKGDFAGCKNPTHLDMSVVGRDILDLFALIVDRQGDVIALLGQRHSYAIETR